MRQVIRTVTTRDNYSMISGERELYASIQMEREEKAKLEFAICEMARRNVNVRWDFRSRFKRNHMLERKGQCRREYFERVARRQIFPIGPFDVIIWRTNSEIKKMAFCQPTHNVTLDALSSSVDFSNHNQTPKLVS